MKMRPYQERAVRSIGLMLADNPSTLLTMATGLGKTVCIAHAIREHCKGRAMVLAHREELVNQNARTIGAVLGEPCDIEMADRHADLGGLMDRARVIVASKDSLHERRLARFDPAEFGMVVVDECFPAGTTIGETPIERLTVGDRVPCADSLGTPTLGTVARLFCRAPSAMVRITFSSGGSLCCTPEHPIWSDGWKAAGSLQSGEVVSRLTTYGNKHLQRLRQDDRVEKESDSDVLARVSAESVVGNDGGDQQKVRLRPHEGAEPDEVCVGATAGLGNHASDGTSPDHSRRQRDRTNRAGAEDRGGAGLDDWPDCPDRGNKGKRGTLAEPLQDRRGERGLEGGDRGRWRIAQVAGPSGPGPQEGRLLEVDRVDRVEVLERGRDGTFGGVCPDGLVYNIEVDPHHTYFANGVLVHNCHHATAASYTRVIDSFGNAKLLGVTATPNRHDGSALGQVFATSAMIYGIADGIRDGWLVPIIAYSPIVTGLDLDDVRTVAGDLCESELAEKLERDRPVHEICTTSIERCGSRRALGFAASVRQSAMIADAMNHYHPNCARHLSGETPRDERAETLAAHRRGEFQFLWNCGLFLEGYDDPGLGAVIMARPTKSLPLFTQMVGRGTRPLPGTVDADESHAGAADAGWRTGRIADSEKPNLLLLNFTANCSRHKLITPADVLGGAYADEDREAAAAMIGDGETDVESALERARIEREESGPKALREEFAKSRTRIVASATYLLKEEDLFDSAFTPGRERTWLTGAAPTEKQIATLERHGFVRDDIVRLSKNECSKLIGGIVMRVQSGLCTVKQAAALKRRGHKNADTYTFEQARQALDRLYGARA